MADGLNQARALRVAELLNDYRTLLVHIPQQHTDAPVEDYWEEGYIVMRECLSAAQNLISSNYEPIPAPSGGSGNEESEKAQLQRVMLDAGARRFQAHRIYLRMAAARRWVMNRAAVMRRMGGMEELKAVSRTFQEVTDQHVLSDLRAADIRAGYWLSDDPNLDSILGWIRSH